MSSRSRQSFEKYLPAQSTVVSVQEHVNGHSANEDDPKCFLAFSCVLTTSPGGAYPKSAVLWLKRSKSKSKIIEHIFSGNRGCFFRRTKRKSFRLQKKQIQTEGSRKIGGVCSIDVGVNEVLKSNVILTYDMGRCVQLRKKNQMLFRQIRIPGILQEFKKIIKIPNEQKFNRNNKTDSV